MNRSDEQTTGGSGMGARGRRATTIVAAIACGLLLAVGIGATPAYADSVSWGSLTCPSGRYVYSQTFSSGYTFHQHQKVGYTSSTDWNVPASGAWHTFYPNNGGSLWPSTANSYVNAQVLQTANRGCNPIF